MTSDTGQKPALALAKLLLTCLLPHFRKTFKLFQLPLGKEKSDKLVFLVQASNFRYCVQDEIILSSLETEQLATSNALGEIIPVDHPIMSPA